MKKRIPKYLLFAYHKVIYPATSFRKLLIEFVRIGCSYLVDNPMRNPHETFLTWTGCCLTWSVLNSFSWMTTVSSTELWLRIVTISCPCFKIFTIQLYKFYSALLVSLLWFHIFALKIKFAHSLTIGVGSHHRTTRRTFRIV